MSRRSRPANRYGCKPDGDVCLAHDMPLADAHGCEYSTARAIQVVYRATTRGGDVCHFGHEGAASAWARGGKVEELRFAPKADPELRLVTNRADAESRLAAAERILRMYADAPEGSIGGEFARGYFGP